MTEEENRIDAVRLRRNAYMRKYRRLNPEKVREAKLHRRPRSKEAKAKNAAWTREWGRRNAEEISARKKLRYLKNKEQVLAKCKQYRDAKNMDRTIARRKDLLIFPPAKRRREYMRRYYAAHSDKHQALVSKRKAMVRGASDGTFTAKQWKEMKAAYGNRCAYCLNVFERLTQDHVIPVSKGGAHSTSNIVPACKSCNSSKNVSLWLPTLKVEIAA
jgi:5-methylcytosine-specific restriction endonuclease McrA